MRYHLVASSVRRFYPVKWPPHVPNKRLAKFKPATSSVALPLINPSPLRWSSVHCGHQCIVAISALWSISAVVQSQLPGCQLGVTDCHLCGNYTHSHQHMTTSLTCTEVVADAKVFSQIGSVNCLQFNVPKTFIALPVCSVAGCLIFPIHTGLDYL